MHSIICLLTDESGAQIVPFEIEGIHAVKLHLSCSERSNRYDMMIEMVMEPEALPVYDASEPHLRWKQEYGGHIEAKAIFDCE